jgi:microcystin-dependent protein
MSQPYVGQIILVAFNFAPSGYAFCDGQLMAIAQNTTLFQLIGTTYGGDGVNTFALPDLRGRVPIGTGQGPGLSPYVIGGAGGFETVTLTTNQLAAHTHVVDISGLTAPPKCTNVPGNQRSPGGNVPAGEAAGVTATYSSLAPDANMASGSITVAGAVSSSPMGGGFPHGNVQPSLALNFCISLFGVFPSQ